MATKCVELNGAIVEIQFRQLQVTLKHIKLLHKTKKMRDFDGSAIKKWGVYEIV